MVAETALARAIESFSKLVGVLDQPTPSEEDIEIAVADASGALASMMRPAEARGEARAKGARRMRRGDARWLAGLAEMLASGSETNADAQKLARIALRMGKLTGSSSAIKEATAALKLAQGIASDHQEESGDPR